MSVPDWVAPVGEKKNLELGDLVFFSHELQGDGDNVWRGWRRFKLGKEKVGVVVGARILYSGRAVSNYVYGDEFGNSGYTEGYRERTVNHRVYLIATHLRKSIVRVSSDDVRKVEKVGKSWQI